MSDQDKEPAPYTDAEVYRGARKRVWLGAKSYEVREPVIALNEDITARYLYIMGEADAAAEALAKADHTQIEIVAAVKTRMRAINEYVIDTIAMFSPELTEDRKTIGETATVSQVKLAYAQLQELLNDPLGLVATVLGKRAAAQMEALQKMMPPVAPQGNRAQRRAAAKQVKKNGTVARTG